MAISTTADHTRLFELLSNNEIEEAKLMYKKFPNILKESVADGKHSSHNPLYALISAKPTEENKIAIDYILQENPDLVNHVSFRCAVVSYCVQKRDDPALIQKLIDLGANVNDQSRYDDMKWKNYSPSYDTAAHIATLGGKEKSLEVLIKNHADLNLKNNAGVTPLDVYFYNTHKASPNISKMITEAGGDVNLVGNSISTALGFGVTEKAWEGITYCLKQTKAIVTKIQLSGIIKGSTESGILDVKGAEAAYYALRHMPADFDFKAYSKLLTYKQNETCRQLVDDLLYSAQFKSPFNPEDFVHVTYPSSMEFDINEHELAQAIEFEDFDYSI